MNLPAGFTLENQEVKLPAGFTLEAEPPKPKTFLNKVTDFGKSVLQNAGEYYDYLHTPTEPAPFISKEWFTRVLPESVSKTTLGTLEFLPKTAVELSGGAGKALNRLTQGQPAEAFREAMEPVANLSEGIKQFIGKPTGFYGLEPFKEAWTADPAGSALALYPGGKALARKAKAIPKAMELKGLDVLEPTETPALRTPPQPVEALGTPKPPKGFTLEEKVKPVEQVKPPAGFTLETDVPDFEPPVKADLPSAETVTEPPQKAVPVITPDTPEKFATIADDFNKRMAKANVEGEKIDPVEVMKQVETDYSKTAPQIPQKTAFQKKMSELIDEETDPARKALLYIKSMGGLDMEALAKDYGKETRAALSKKGIGVVSSKGKARIDEVALDMGFPDGDTLINAILDTKSKKELAKAEKDAFENYHYDNIRLAKKGFEKTDGIYPETLDTGDKVLINDESYTVRGFDKDGRVILKDGETLFVDPFEKLDAEGIKRATPKTEKPTPEETAELPGLGFKDTFDLTSEGAGDVYKGELPTKAPAPKQENLFDTKAKLVKLEDIQKKNKPDMIIKKNVLANERGAINLDATKEALENIKDKLTIDAVPKMSRAGVGDMAVQHASARIAVPKMVDDLLSKVFPESYKDPARMSKTIDILNKDNILGGYDSFITQATRDRLNNEFGASQRNLAAANRIKEKHDLNAYQTDVNAARLDPEIMGNIERWMKVIVPEFDRLFNEVKDVDPNTPRWGRGRNFDARINLVSDAKAEQIQKYLSDPKAPEPEPVATNYLNPHIKRDPFDRAADFTGKYTDDARTVLSAVLGPRWNEVTKIRMYKDLIKKGAAVEMTEGVEKPVMIQGQKPVAFIAEFPHTTENGYSFPSKKLLYVRKDIVNELRQVLNTEIPAESNKAAQILTNIQLAQIADAVTHSKNLLSVVSRAQGAGSAWYDVVRKMPVFNTFESIGRVIQVSREVFADTPEIRTEIAQMAKQGLIRPEFPATGIQKITHAQQFLHHVDTGARIIMNRFFDNLVERGLVENTLKNRRDYCNQVGQYNKRLMGFWMAKAAQSCASPFIVAGRNFNRQGRNAITGNPGVEAISPIAAAQMRLTNLAGTAMLFTLPMMLNMLTTGEVGGRSGTPLGAWDMGLPEDEKGRHRTLDFTTIIGARRGMRSIGLDAAIEGIRQGHAPDQIAGQMFKDITGTMAHPWLGPAPQFAVKFVWGKQLDMRPDWTRQTVPEGGSKQIVENLRAATENQNPLVYAITRPLWQETGLDQKPEKPYFTELGETFLKSPYSSFGVRDMYPGQTAAEKAAQEISGSKFYGPSTKEEKERGALVGQYTRKLADALKKNQDINPIIDEVIKLAQEGKLHEKDLDKIEKNVEEPPLERRFSQMKIREALVVWNLATPEEKDRLVDMFEKKIDNLAEHDEQEFTKYEKQIMKAVNEYVDMKIKGGKP